MNRIDIRKIVFLESKMTHSYSIESKYLNESVRRIEDKEKASVGDCPIGFLTRNIIYFR